MPDRPGKLFDGLEHIRLSIIILRKANAKQSKEAAIFTTKYNKWHSSCRENLFPTLSYVNALEWPQKGSIPKIYSLLEVEILQKILSQDNLELFLTRSGSHKIFYTRKISGFLQILDFIPTILDGKGNSRDPSELKNIEFEDSIVRDCFLAGLNSSLFYWIMTVYSDCRNLNKREILSFPFNPSKADASLKAELSLLAQRLMQDLKANSNLVEMNYKKLGKLKIQCFYPKYSKTTLRTVFWGWVGKKLSTA